MKKIELTQGKVALVNDKDFVRLNQWKWCVVLHNKNDWHADCLCADCGHIHKKGNMRHEYHHENYEADKQEVVVVLCTTCHTKRHLKNGTWGRRKPK